MSNKKTQNYTFTCPTVLKNKFENEFIQAQKDNAGVSINNSKIFRIMMEILLDKKDQFDFSEVYDDATLKQAFKDGLEKND